MRFSDSLCCVKETMIWNLFNQHSLKCHVDLTALSDSYVVSLSANIEGTGFLSGHADGSIVRWYVADDHNPRPQVSQTTLGRNKRHKAEQMTLLKLQRHHKGTVKCAPLHWRAYKFQFRVRSRRQIGQLSFWCYLPWDRRQIGQLSRNRRQIGQL